jgi:PPOX class probable F420-dependent enzyme
MRIPQAVIENLLSAWPLARLATTNVDGSPHQVPIVFTWHSDCFWSPIDGKPKQNNQLLRVVNALANPTGSILIDNYEEDWSRLWWIRAKIEISVIELTAASTNVQETAAEVVGKLKAKYPQYGSTEVLSEPATMLSMSPTAWTSWCASEFLVSEEFLGSE